MSSSRDYEQSRKAEHDEAVAMSGKGWKHIGDVGVDTGRIVICDPCNGYHIGDSDWDGVITASGHGDGIYPVFARYENGVVAEVKIVFLEEIKKEESKNARQHRATGYHHL